MMLFDQITALLVINRIS